MTILSLKPLGDRKLELDVSWDKPSMLNKPDYGSLRLILRDKPCSHWITVTFGIVADMGGEREALKPEWEFPTTWATQKSIRAAWYPAAKAEPHLAQAWGLDPLEATLVNDSIATFFNRAIEDVVQPYMNSCANYSLTRRQARRHHRALFDLCRGLDFSC